VRRPFFLMVSVAAIVFIVSLYHRLHPSQRALTWGLPLVLGGALGNLTDRIVRNSVIDFIDYRAGWVGQMNEFIATRLSSGWTVTEHWPTFNVADVSICAGVALMAIDMMFSRRGPVPTARERTTTGAGSTSPDTADEGQRPSLGGLPAGASAPPPSP
jgi:signal peptidase II